MKLELGLTDKLCRSGKKSVCRNFRAGHLMKFRVAISLSIALLCGLPSNSQTEQRLYRPLTIEDILQVAVIGDAGFSPNGRWLAYTMTPPYDVMSDFSYWLSAAGTSGHQLWVTNTQGKAEPRLQPGLDRGASNFFAGFSPDSEWVLVLEHKFGRLRYVGCRVGENNCVRFDAQPDLRDGYFTALSWNERIEWTSDHSFLFPARHDFLPGAEWRNRGAIGHFLWQQWSRAWMGKGATATSVVSTAKDRSDDWASGKLYEADLQVGTMRLVADGRYTAPRISPDRKLVVSARTGERERSSVNYQPLPYDNYSPFDRRFALSLTDLHLGTTWHFAEPFNIDPNSITWSSDSSQASVYGWKEGDEPSEGAFYVLNMGTRTISRRPIDALVLGNNMLSPEAPFFHGPAQTALLDAGLIVYAKKAGSDRFDWYLLGDHRVRNLTRDLPDVPGVLLYANGNSVLILTDQGVLDLSASGTSRYIFRRSEDHLTLVPVRSNTAHGWSRRFYFDAPINWSLFAKSFVLSHARSSHGDDELVSINVSTRKPERFVLGVADARTLAAFPGADMALITVKEGGATRLILVRGNQPPIDLSIINQHLNEIQPIKVEPFSYTLTDVESEGSRSIEGCLILPPNYVEGKRYPVLIDVYPSGSLRRCRSFADAPHPSALVKDLWTTRGFIYFRPEIPLDFARTPEGPITEAPSIVGQAVDALIDQGFADADRVILYGFSQGGTLSLYIAAYSDKFAAVISINGWANFFSHYFGGRGLLSYFHLDQAAGHNRWRYECLETGKDHLCPFGFGHTALEDPESYARTSPVALAAKISAPVLLVHSDLDYFAMGQYDEMFLALYRAGKEARYVRYWGEGHAPSSPANIRDLWDQFDSFLCDLGVVSDADALQRVCGSAIPRGLD